MLRITGFVVGAGASAPRYADDKKGRSVPALTQAQFDRLYVVCPAIVAAQGEVARVWSPMTYVGVPMPAEHVPQQLHEAACWEWAFQGAPNQQEPRSPQDFYAQIIQAEDGWPHALVNGWDQWVQQDIPNSQANVDIIHASFDVSMDDFVLDPGTLGRAQVSCAQAIMALYVMWRGRNVVAQRCDGRVGDGKYCASMRAERWWSWDHWGIAVQGTRLVDEPPPYLPNMLEHLLRTQRVKNYIQKVPGSALCYCSYTLWDPVGFRKQVVPEALPLPLVPARSGRAFRIRCRGAAC